MSTDSSEFEIFFQNPLREKEYQAKVGGYRFVLENLPSHQAWFSWDAFHQVVYEMVRCEIEIEFYDRQISKDYDNNGGMAATRAKQAGRLESLRNRLGLDATKMQKLTSGKTEHKTIKERLGTMMKQYEEFTA